MSAVIPMFPLPPRPAQSCRVRRPLGVPTKPTHSASSTTTTVVALSRTSTRKGWTEQIFVDLDRAA